MSGHCLRELCQRFVAQIFDHVSMNVGMFDVRYEFAADGSAEHLGAIATHICLENVEVGHFDFIFDLDEEFL